jgi:hypothetical protein
MFVERLRVSSQSPVEDQWRFPHIYTAANACSAERSARVNPYLSSKHAILSRQ